jgi:hypothetical protein
MNRDQRGRRGPKEEKETVKFKYATTYQHLYNFHVQISTWIRKKASDLFGRATVFSESSHEVLL